MASQQMRDQPRPSVLLGEQEQEIETLRSPSLAVEQLPS